jgi:ComF family protein
VSILSRRLLNIGSMLERILPAQPCQLCGAMSLNGTWCSDCDASLPHLDNAHCPVCALPSPQGEICGQCLKKRPLFDRTIAAYAYMFPMDKLIQSLKYNAQLQLAGMLTTRLAQRIECLPDFIVPMPLHPARLRERGFNQSLELARHLAHRLDIPLLPDACKRVRNTPRQSALKWKERSKNMRKAFSCTGDFSGKHVAIVDDVMTSGASMNELALALRRAGAREIDTWVVARTLPHET